MHYWSFFNDTATTEIYTLSLHDALPIYDLHERFSPDQAIRIMRSLELYNPFFIEDPIAPDCVDSLRYVREKTSVPIAFGELYKSRWECLPAITGHWVDYIRCDVIRVGGITEARKIASLAETYDIKTAWHGPNDVSPITHAVNWHLKEYAGTIWYVRTDM